MRDDAGGPCADDMQVQEAADRPQTGRLLAGRRTGTPRRDPGPQEARRGGERVPHRLAASGLLSRAARMLVPPSGARKLRPRAVTWLTLCQAGPGIRRRVQARVWPLVRAEGWALRSRPEL